MVDAVVTWLRSQVGNGYCWGGTGVVCTPMYRERLAKQYPAQAENLLGICAKWDGKPVYDCAQLVKAALKRMDISMVSGATSQYKQSGVWESSGIIGNIPSGILAVIFRESKEKPGTFGHVGFRLPDGTTIEAMDSANGVVHRALLSSKWTHYKIPVGADRQTGGGGGEDIPAVTPPVDIDTVTVAKVHVRLRKQPKIQDGTNHNRICELPQGYTAPILERHDGWTRIAYRIHKGWVRDDMLHFN